MILGMLVSFVLISVVSVQSNAEVDDQCNMLSCEKLSWNRLESTGTATIERSQDYVSEGYNSLLLNTNGMWWTEIEGSEIIVADIDESTEEAIFMVDIFSDAIPLESYVGVVQLAIKAHPNDWYDYLGTILYNIPPSDPFDFTTYQIRIPSYQTGLLKNGNPFKIKLAFSVRPDTSFWLDNMRFCNDENDCHSECVFLTDLDSLDDEWELEHFGDLLSNGDDDNDNDGLNNFVEYVLRTNPMSPSLQLEPGTYYRYDDLGRIEGVVTVH